MLTFTTLSLPSISLAMSSSEGPIMRHGPHHSAQKSTRTGVSDFRTSCSKEVSVALTVIWVLPKTLQAGRWTGAALGPKARNAHRASQDAVAYGIDSSKVFESISMSSGTAVHRRNARTVRPG